MTLLTILRREVIKVVKEMPNKIVDHNQELYMIISQNEIVRKINYGKKIQLQKI